MLEKNKEKVRMTIRSKAAKALEVISGKIYLEETIDNRKILTRSLHGFKTNLRKVNDVKASLARKVNSPS